MLVLNRIMEASSAPALLPPQSSSQEAVDNHRRTVPSNNSNNNNITSSLTNSSSTRSRRCPEASPSYFRNVVSLNPSDYDSSIIPNVSSSSPRSSSLSPTPSSPSPSGGTFGNNNKTNNAKQLNLQSSSSSTKTGTGPGEEAATKVGKTNDASDTILPTANDMNAFTSIDKTLTTGLTDIQEDKCLISDDNNNGVNQISSSNFFDDIDSPYHSHDSNDDDDDDNYEINFNDNNNNNLIPLVDVHQEVTTTTPITTNVRSRKSSAKKGDNHHHRNRMLREGRRRSRRRNNKKKSSSSNHHHGSSNSNGSDDPNGSCSSSSSSSSCCCSWCGGKCGIVGQLFWCCNDKKIVRSTLSCMNIVAKILSWCTVVAMVAGVVWYSYELKKTGKDPHLILWNSAAAFVLLGFPISIYGIVMHLARYNQPNTQMYIVRILWMVPMYSLQSWLGLRFKDNSIYFETLRDLYESYVLYSFFQYLIEVLGGEEALILMLKDKSPTRGVHMWGMEYFLKPWLMGQPVRKTYMDNENSKKTITTGGIVMTLDDSNSGGGTAGCGGGITAAETSINLGGHNQPIGGIMGKNNNSNELMMLQHHQPNYLPRHKTLKRVHWTSPFFVYCKFGVLQYVLLKFVSAIIVFILEPFGLYKEGNFTYKGGYLYTSLVINTSQTVALYCLILFYYACKNELTPIRAVGKFLAVKLLVFATWWQSLFINILLINGFIKSYSYPSTYFSTAATATGIDENDVDPDDINNLDMINSSDGGGIRPEPDWSVPLSDEDATALDTLGGKAFWPTPDTIKAVATGGIIEYSPEEVSKALQNYLICIEMFVFAIVHIFVFPHSEYSPEAVEARARALNQMPNKHWNKRLGRKWKEYDNKSAWSGTTTSNCSTDAEDSTTEIELFPMMTNNNNNNNYGNHHHHAATAQFTTGTESSLSCYANNSNNNHQHYSVAASPAARRRKNSFDDDDDLRVHPLDTLDELESYERQPLISDDDDDGSFDDCSICSDDDGIDNKNNNDIEKNNATAATNQNNAASTNNNDNNNNNIGGVGGGATTIQKKKNFFSALIDSTIPQDLRDDTVGIIKGDYVVERKTLLHHAATSDSYDLFSRRFQRRNYHHHNNNNNVEAAVADSSSSSPTSRQNNNTNYYDDKNSNNNNNVI